jgi:glycosyltransferase involved in cell wall biosynthesis
MTAPAHSVSAARTGSIARAPGQLRHQDARRSPERSPSQRPSPAADGSRAWVLGSGYLVNPLCLPGNRANLGTWDLVLPVGPRARATHAAIERRSGLTGRAGLRRRTGRAGGRALRPLASHEVMTASHVDDRSGSDRLRVLHLLPDLAIGGGQTIVLNHIREADRDRFEVDVAYLRGPTEFAQAFADAGSTPICLDHVAGHWPRTLRRLVNEVRRLKPDVIHLHTGTDRLYGLAAAALTRTAVVYHLHGRYVHLGQRGRPATWRECPRVVVQGPLFDWLERRTVRHYVATSEDIRALFAPMVRAASSTVLRQSMPLERFDAAMSRRLETRSALGIGESTPMLINVSRLVDGKGQADLVQMMAELAEPHADARLFLVGDGELHDVLQAQVDAAGLTGRVRLLGNRHDVPDLLAAADVFVFASNSEGFGLAVLEAMAARRAVAAYRLPALTEFVQHGSTGYLVELGDTGALATAVERLLDDAALADRMGAAGRVVVETRFPAEATARTLEQVYSAVTGAAAR